MTILPAVCEKFNNCSQKNSLLCCNGVTVILKVSELRSDVTTLSKRAKFQTDNQVVLATQNSNF